MKTDGTLWTWGYNGNGQLGDGTTTSHSSPEQIGTDTNWQSVSAGGEHNVALKTDGTLWAWGNNGNGQLGDGTTNQHNSPEQIGTDSNWKSVKAGLDFTVAVKTDGGLWAWGYNGNDQLGDGTTNQQNSPEQIEPTVKWSVLPTGGMGAANFTLVTSTDGTLWAWGSNSNSQLAGAAIDPTVPERTLPAFTTQTLSFPSVHFTIGVPVSLAATCDSGLPISYSVSGPATLSANQLTVTAPGTVNLIAYQVGDADWGSTGPVAANFTATTTPQTISNFPATLALSTTASPYTLSATASSGLGITYSVVSGPAGVSGSTLTLFGAGTVVLSATQAGNGLYAPVSDTETITVTTAAQSISNFPATQTLSESVSPVMLPSSTSDGLTVTYTVVSGPATVSGDTLTFTGSGTVILTATQAGSSIFAPLSDTETITVTPPTTVVTNSGGTVGGEEGTPTMPEWGLGVLAVLLTLTAARQRPQRVS